jgi:hypothetical protein
MRKFLILLTITFSSITIFAADDYVKVLTDFGVNSKSIEVLTNYTKSLNTDDAKTDLLKAIELDSENYHTYDYLGAIAKSEGHFKAAIDYFKKSIDIFPNGYIAYQNLGDVYRTLGAYAALEAYGGRVDYDNALKYYNILIDKHPERYEGYYGLASINIVQKKYSEANKYALLSLEILDSFDNYTYPRDLEWRSPYISDSAKILEMSDYSLGNYQKVIDSFLKYAVITKKYYSNDDLQNGTLTQFALAANNKITDEKQKQENDTKFKKLGIITSTSD